MSATPKCVIVYAHSAPSSIPATTHCVNDYAHKEHQYQQLHNDYYYEYVFNFCTCLAHRQQLRTKRQKLFCKNQFYGKIRLLHLSFGFPSYNLNFRLKIRETAFDWAFRQKSANPGNDINGAFRDKKKQGNNF